MHICFHEPHFHRIQKAKTKVKVSIHYKRMDALTRRMGNAVSVDLNKGLTTFKKKISPEELMKAWSSGSYTAVLRHIPWYKLPDDLKDYSQLMDRTYTDSTDMALEALPPPINKNLRYDINNPRLRQYMQSHTGKLIEKVTNDMRLTVLDAVQNTFTKGWTPRTVAEHIKGSIGLDQRRATALANYRTTLESKNQFSQDKIDSMVARYSDDLLKQRAMTIGRTETRNATNDSQLSVWREGAQQGFIDKQKAKKVWVVDGNPCEICEPMDGVAVGIDDVWILDSGDAVDIPSEAHPNCYCGMELDFGDDEDEE